MKRLFVESDWPDVWKYSYIYDELEIWGGVANRGYAYAYEVRKRNTLRLLYEALPVGSSVLDVAAAQGNFSLILAEAGYKVTWNDLRVDLAEYVQMKHEYGEIEFAPGNVFELGFCESFDCVLITEIIEHVAHPDEFLMKIAEMVKPGGCIVMSTPNGAYFRNKLPRFSDCGNPEQYEAVQFKPNSDGHIFLLWAEEIAQLAASAGLVLEEYTTYSNPLTSGHIKLGSVLSVFPKALVMKLEWLTGFMPEILRCKLTAGSSARFRKPM